MSDLRAWLLDTTRNQPKPGTYVVIRVARTYPHRVPADLDGKWYDLADIPTVLASVLDGVQAWETGRFETRDDGAVAQVFEIR
jgi:hypothetical protein